MHLSGTQEINCELLLVGEHPFLNSFVFYLNKRTQSPKHLLTVYFLIIFSTESTLVSFWHSLFNIRGNRKETKRKNTLAGLVCRLRLGPKLWSLSGFRPSLAWARSSITLPMQITYVLCWFVYYILLISDGIIIMICIHHPISAQTFDLINVADQVSYWVGLR